jgi:hypothetical protein
MKRIFALFGSLLMLVLTGCGVPRMDVPEGFAPVKRGGRTIIREALSGTGSFKAVSPEGMVIRLRSEKNEPRKDLDFWSEALVTQLESEGYKRRGEGVSVSSAAKEKGLYYEWIVPYDNQDYMYVTCVIPIEKRIVILETAADLSLYGTYKDRILACLGTISLR